MMSQLAAWRWRRRRRWLCREMMEVKVKVKVKDCSEITDITGLGFYLIQHRLTRGNLIWVYWLIMDFSRLGDSTFYVLA